MGTGEKGTLYNGSSEIEFFLDSGAPDRASPTHAGLNARVEGPAAPRPGRAPQPLSPEFPPAPAQGACVQAVVKTTRGPGAEVRTVPDPVPKDDEVLVAVRASSVCGTDVHLWQWNEWAASRMKTIPLVLGHELSGEVVQVGKRVSSLAVGDHVSAETHIADGTCYQCRNGKMHICQNVQVLGVDRDGVFAEYTVLPAMNAWKNDPSLDHSIASIQEPLGNAVHSLVPEEGLADLTGANVLVTGCGPIGLLAITVARLLGAHAVYATEVNPLRAGLAKQMGADRVLNPVAEGPEVLRTLLSETGGNGVDVAVEMSGHPASLQLAFDALTSGGRVSLLGLYDREAALHFDEAIITKGARVYGIFGRRMFTTWFQVKALLARPELKEKMAAIITHRLPIRDLPKAMELLQSMQASKISLEPKW